MAQNTEQIEARLCAYVDGELDAVERAEIEKHLAANPAHRLLLHELMQTRDLLQALPHERAPQDVAEVLQGHLERSVLLDGPMELEAQTAGRINRWSQYRAVAAILLLTAGLAGVIYKILPSNRPQPQFTFAPKESTPTTAPDTSDPATGGERDRTAPAPTESRDAIASKVGDADAIHGKMSASPVLGKEG